MELTVMKRAFLSLASVALCANSASAASNCSQDFVYFVFGQDFQKHLTVKSGLPCTSGFNIRGGGVRSMVITQRTSHGIAALSGTSSWAYKSNAGYVGSDRFALRISGETMGRYTESGDSNIDVTVNVVP